MIGNRMPELRIRKCEECRGSCQRSYYGKVGAIQPEVDN